MQVIDSNIWAYYLDKTTPEHNAAVAFLDPCLQEGHIAITTTIALEVIHYLFRRLGTNIGFEKSNIFQLGSFQVLEFTSQDFDGLLEIMKKVAHLGLGSRDAAILACMQRENLTKLVTHDKAFTHVQGIEVIDPIKP
ncbi:MAG: type II toxin-antitoxin system VapC family toxin [Candidatus Heimdallarchaeota archaeon]